MIEIGGRRAAREPRRRSAARAGPSPSRAVTPATSAVSAQPCRASSRADAWCRRRLAGTGAGDERHAPGTASARTRTSVRACGSNSARSVRRGSATKSTRHVGLGAPVLDAAPATRGRAAREARVPWRSCCHSSTRRSDGVHRRARSRSPAAGPAPRWPRGERSSRRRGTPGCRRGRTPAPPARSPPATRRPRVDRGDGQRARGPSASTARTRRDSATGSTSGSA